MDNSLPHVLFDFSRPARVGLPEAVFCEKKPLIVLQGLLEKFSSGEPPILFTRLREEIFARLPSSLQTAYNYDAVSGTAFANCCLPLPHGSVGIISAGSADAPVAFEAARTLEYLGIRRGLYEDCGISALWRLAGKLDVINSHEVLIVIAGMEGALASVVGGLSPRPIFAVPTSVGYGASAGGKAALAGMLASCAPGIAVLNIDNGYGAACAAARVINQLNAAKGNSGDENDRKA